MQTGWIKSDDVQNGWIWHDDGKPWNEVDLPTGIAEWFYRVLHTCSPVSFGVAGWDVCERCACGAVRWGVTDPNDFPWSPNSTERLRFLPETGWDDRNSRYLGTAQLYLPTARSLIQKWR